MMASLTERSRTTAFPPNSGMKAMSAAAFPAVDGEVEGEAEPQFFYGDVHIARLVDAFQRLLDHQVLNRREVEQHYGKNQQPDYPDYRPHDCL